MLADADKFKAEDDIIKAKLAAKNEFEGYCYQLKDTLNMAKLKDSFTNPEKRAIEDLCEEGLAWMADNADASSDDIANKKKDLMGKFNPIMVRVYEEAGVSQS